MWQCSNCGKEFAKVNQWHMCESAPLSVIFKGNQDLQMLYSMLFQKIEPLGQVKETTSAKAITLYAPSNMAFLIVQPKKSFIDIFFPLNKIKDDFPVYKVVQTSKSKYAHYARLYQPEDVDSTLISLIRESYLFISGKE